MNTTYMVYQVCRDLLDRETYLGVTCDYHDDGWLDRCTAVWNDGLYLAMMKIDSPDLDTVFEIGNFMGDTQPIMLRPRPHSVSIGDIIKDTENGRLFVVAPFGFTELVLN